jgi:hypothetical protein
VRRDRLVEADAAKPPGERRVVDDVVLLQRLLDQQEVEAVELGEGVGIGEVYASSHRPAARSHRSVPHRGGVGDVAPRLDLDLDPHVALVEVAGDGVDEGIRTLLDADGHPARHAIDRRAEVLPERPSPARRAASRTASSSPAFTMRCPTKGSSVAPTSSGLSAHVEQRRDRPALRRRPRPACTRSNTAASLCDDLAPAVAVGGGPDHDDLAHRSVPNEVVNGETSGSAAPAARPRRE